MTGPGGSEDAFGRTAPEWARGLRPQLHADLVAWCRFNNAALAIEDSAGVWPA